MKAMWWVLCITAVAELGLLAALGPERALHAMPWVLAPANAAGACVAFYYWNRLRRGAAKVQAAPLLPLGIALLLYAARYIPGMLDIVRSDVSLAIFVAVLVWFLVTYVWELTREFRAASKSGQPNDR